MPRQLLRHRLLLAVVACVCLSGAWSLAIPLLASPDEPAHMFNAAAVVDGQLDTKRVTIPGLGFQHEVELPSALVRLEHSADCIVVDPSATAACVRPAADDRRRVVTTQFGRYPPTYYAVVGVVGARFSGADAAWAMRLASVLLNGGLLGLGLWLTSRFHRSQLALPACAVALTPAVFGLAGVINANGLEVAAAFAGWCGLAALVSRDDAPPLLLVGIAGPLAALLICRPTSPMWVGIALVLAAALMGRDRVMALSRDRVARRSAVGLGVCVAAWAAWTAAVGTPSLLGEPPDERGLAAGLHVIWDAIPDRTRSLMGNLLAVPAPRWVLVVFGSGLIGLAVVAWRRGRRGFVGGIVLASIAFATAVVLELAQFDEFGPWWQARYSLPLLVGVPVVLCSTTRVEVPTSVRAGVAAVFVLVQIGVLAWGVHRFGVVPGGGWAASDFRWRPPHLWIFGGLVLVGGVAMWLTLADQWRPERAPTTSGDPGVTRTHVGDVAGGGTRTR